MPQWTSTHGGDRTVNSMPSTTDLSWPQKLALTNHGSKQNPGRRHVLPVGLTAAGPAGTVICGGFEAVLGASPTTSGSSRLRKGKQNSFQLHAEEERVKLSPVVITSSDMCNLEAGNYGEGFPWWIETGFSGICLSQDAIKKPISFREQTATFVAPAVAPGTITVSFRQLPMYHIA